MIQSVADSDTRTVRFKIKRSDGPGKPARWEEFDVPVQVSAVLGRSKMDVADLLKLGPGTVLELDRRVGEAIDIYVNNRLVARGERFYLGRVANRVDGVVAPSRATLQGAAGERRLSLFFADLPPQGDHPLA